MKTVTRTRVSKRRKVAAEIQQSPPRARKRNRSGGPLKTSERRSRPSGRCICSQFSTTTRAIIDGCVSLPLIRLRFVNSLSGHAKPAVQPCAGRDQETLDPSARHHRLQLRSRLLSGMVCTLILSQKGVRIGIVRGMSYLTRRASWKEVARFIVVWFFESFPT